ncbi:2-oxoadipate dioxygenase/decarboxylase family protein [Tropicibacter sp. S64]|uniref:2-oxoadipate dioxygenase/decarboxylase family protein n=1 Tax=Tropicibacter sp. S64 TaxID=3415122 RepID=UPI003C7E3ECB
MGSSSGGLDEADAKRFVAEVLETFRWHAGACVDATTFGALIDAHRLIADVVSFKGPHINHLTPKGRALYEQLLAEVRAATCTIRGWPISNTARARTRHRARTCRRCWMPTL